MKRDWEPQELIEHWAFSPQELELLRNKTGATRLGYAVNLKFFQQTAQFPSKPRDIPRMVLTYVAQQVNVPATEFASYDCNSRAAKYHRSEIREFCGFRSPTAEDAKTLQAWLLEHLLPQSNDIPFLEQGAIAHLRSIGVEPMSPLRLDRIIRAALRQHEQAFCQTIAAQLSPQTCQQFDQLLTPTPEANDSTLEETTPLDLSDERPLRKLATDPKGASLRPMLQEGEKLQQIRQFQIPLDLFTQTSSKVVTRYRRRAATERRNELRRHAAPVRYTLLAALYWQRGQEITDNLVDVLLQMIHKLSRRAEQRVNQQLTQEFKRVDGKNLLLYHMARASLADREGKVKDVIFAVASPTVLENIVREFESGGTTYRQREHYILRRAYQHHYRRMLPKVLDLLEFRSNNTAYQPIIQGLALLKKYIDSQDKYFPSAEALPLEGLLRSSWREVLLESDAQGEERIDRVNFELVVLKALRTGIRSKEIWVVGANRYRNPDQDLPADFEAQRVAYYQALKLPLDVEVFITGLQSRVQQSLTELNDSLPNNSKVKLLQKQNGWIQVSPLAAQAEPRNLVRLKTALIQRWPMTSLLDVLKEADLRIGFTQAFQSLGTRETLDPLVLRKRLLLCLYALGTNTGLKRVSAASPQVSREDLRYIRRRFIHPDMACG